MTLNSTIKEQIQRIEQLAVQRLSKQRGGAAIERPPCYREAEWDEHGFLVPSTAEQLRSDASNHRRARTAWQQRDMKRYLTPTTKWPGGKARCIEERVGLMTGSPRAIRALARQFKSHGKSLEKLTQDDLDSLPFELRLQIFILGFMDEAPGEVTRDALAVFHPVGLRILLALDPPNERPPRSEKAKAGDAETADLRAFEALLPVLREYGARIIDADTLHHVLAGLQEMLGARAVVALEQAIADREHAEILDAMTAVREHGWTVAAVRHRRERVADLVAGLRRAEPKGWPLSRVVQLILHSEQDWADPPCPKLVAAYRDRPDDLGDLIKKDLARAANSSTASSRARR